MTTLADMTDTVLNEITSYVRQQESITVITGAIGASDLSFTVDDPKALSKGLIEIDDELVYVKTVSPTTGSVQVMPGGRGWRESDAATHSANAIVRNSPTFPRVQVARAINETIKAIDLYQLAKYDVTFDGTRFAYPLPVGAVDVTGVSAETYDPSKQWERITRFRVDSNYWEDSDTSARMAVEIEQYPTPGLRLRFQYLSPATPMALPSTDFATTGLPASAEDVIRLGAMHRLVSTVDPGKVIARTPSADALDAPVQAGRPTDTARYLYQLFATRLAEEKAKLADNFQTVIHRQG